MRYLVLLLALIVGNAGAQPVAIPSAVGTLTYNVGTATVATPAFTPGAGSYPSTQTVSIASTAGATIYYTLDNSAPTTGSTVYSGALTVSTSQQIRALGVKSGMNNSAIGSASYSIGAPTIPTQASTVGYNTNTYSIGVAQTNVFSASTVDINNTQNSGYLVYKCNMNGAGYPPLTTDIVFPGDGSVEMTGYSGVNAELCSAAAKPRYTNFVGNAFGAGAYFEIIAKFPVGNFSGSAVWPAIWSQTLEGSIINGNGACPLSGFSNTKPCNNWPGQASTFNHQIEDDWMEYIGGALRSALHESFGISSATCTISVTAVNFTSGLSSGATSGTLSSAWSRPSALYTVSFSNGDSRTVTLTSGATTATWSSGLTSSASNAGSIAASPHNYCQNDTHMPTYSIGTADVSQYHKYGRLWVPATSTSGGYISYYFDDVLQGSTCTGKSTCWSQVWQNTGVAPFIPSNLSNYCGGLVNSTTCSNPNWTYSVMDIFHQVFILGTGTGNRAPMYIKTINIWQANSSGNLTQ